jgi:hypothetical protein
MKFAEALVVQIERIEQGGVEARPFRRLRYKQREGLESADKLHDDIEKHHRRQQGKRYGEELPYFPAPSSVAAS